MKRLLIIISLIIIGSGVVVGVDMMLGVNPLPDTPSRLASIIHFATVIIFGGVIGVAIWWPFPDKPRTRKDT